MTDVLHVLRHDPLVVSVSVRAGSPAAEIDAALRGDHPGSLFAAVVEEQHLGLLSALLGRGGSRVREVVFTAVERDDAQSLALRGIEDLGLGQDFVFTVPGFDDAVAYATRAVQSTEAGGWDADAVLVIGSR